MHKLCGGCCDCNSKAEESDLEFEQQQQTAAQYGEQVVAHVIMTQPASSDISVRNSISSNKGDAQGVKNIIESNRNSSSSSYTVDAQIHSNKVESKQDSENQPPPEEQFVDFNIKLPSMTEGSRYGDIAEMIFKRSSYFNSSKSTIASKNSSFY